MKNIVWRTLCVYCPSLLVWFSTVYADGSDPFPTIDTGSDTNVIDVTGEQMQQGMKYILIGVGILMIVIGIGVVAHRLREDSTNKDSGSFITTLIIAAISITIGIILIAIAWTAASDNISS